MAPRPRKPEHRGLPARWRWKNGAYRYQVPPGQEARWDGKKEFTLGATLSEAAATWAARVEPPAQVSTVGAMLDAFDHLYIPTLSPKTQASYRAALVKLRKVFGHMQLTAIEPHHIYKYVDARKPKITVAHREIETLGSAYTFVISKGWLSYHPIRDKVRLESPPKRTRYVEDSELAIFKAAAHPDVFAYTWLRELTGLRRADILTLQPRRHFKEDGIHVQPRKTAKTTGKRLVIGWSDELRAAVALAEKVRPKSIDIAPWLFCNRDGDCHFDHDTGNANGWDMKWKRTMDRALKAGLAERFTDRDIRKKVATDAATLEIASRLLGHADPRTTAKYYRLVDHVKPTR